MGAQTCVAAHGITIGSEVSGGIEDITFTNMRLLASPGNGVAMVKLKNEVRIFKNSFRCYIFKIVIYN